MISVTIAGNTGKDAQVKTVGQDTVCSFSVATTRKIKDEEQTIWVDVSLWGKRGAALAPYLTKGSKVTVIGELSTREYEGKTYLQVRAYDVALQGGKRDDARNGATAGVQEPPF